MTQIHATYQSAPEAIAYYTQTVFPQIFGHFRPPERITPSQWAYKNRVITKGSLQGRWDPMNVPYMIEPMNDTINPIVEEISIMKSSQGGGTDGVNNILAYYMDVEPSDILVVDPTLAIARKYSKDVLDHLIHDTPKLAEIMSKERSKDKTNTILHKKFIGGTLYIIGANSAASFRQLTARIIFKDDVDGFPPSVGEEGDPFKLADTRAETYRYSKKIINCSTPTVDGISRIQQSYDSSSQGHYIVPCPNCGKFIKLVFSENTIFADLPFANGKLLFDKHNATWAHYQCGFCKKEIHEHQKADMVRAGKYIHTYPDRIRHRGYHFNQLYSLIGSTWLDIVIRFLEAKKAHESLKVWINQVAAEVVRETNVDNINLKSLEERLDVYQVRDLTEEEERHTCRYIVPMGALILTAAVDVQKNRLECVIKGWGIDEESWIIDRRIFKGSPGRSDTWQELENYLDQQFLHESKMPMRIISECIDSGGHFTQIVYSFVKRRNDKKKRSFAIKGKDGSDRLIVGKLQDGNRYRAPFFIVGVDAAKELIYDRVGIKDEGAKYMHFNQDCDEDYFAQLVSEKHIQYMDRRSGTIRSKWVKKQGVRNEALDLEVYNLAAFYALNANMRAVHKNFLERLEKFDPADKAAPAQKQKTIRRKSYSVKNW